MLFALRSSKVFRVVNSGELGEGEDGVALDGREEHGEFADVERAGDRALVHKEEAHARDARGASVLGER